MNPSENSIGTAAGTVGLGLYASGARLVVQYPATGMRYSFYVGPITQVGGAEAPLAQALRDGGITFNGIVVAGMPSKSFDVTARAFSHLAES